MTRAPTSRAAPAVGPGDASTQDPALRYAPALWFALCVTFSPVAIELIQDWPNVYSAGSMLLPIAMLITLAMSGRPTGSARMRPLGLALLVLGVSTELLGISAGAWSIARLGPALAVTGLLMWTHRWAFNAAALAFGCVPVPAFAAVATTPIAEVAYGAIAIRLLDGIGLAVPMVGPLVGSGSSILELQPAYNGLHVSWMLALIGWYAGVRRPGPRVASLRNALIGALLGPPIQLAAIVVAIALVASGHPGPGRLWMEQGLWITIAIGGYAWVEIPLRRGDRDQIVR